MDNGFQINDIVKYLFGDTPTYKVVATKKQPHLKNNGESVIVPAGYDYLIIKTPLGNGEFAPFLPVPEGHIELDAKK
jgi:hypothetical protein